MDDAGLRPVCEGWSTDWRNGCARRGCRIPAGCAKPGGVWDAGDDADRICRVVLQSEELMAAILPALPHADLLLGGASCGLARINRERGPQVE